MKKAIIIGATSGMGREIASRLALDGWEVVATGRREDRLQSLVTEHPGCSILAARMDVTSEDATAVLDSILVQTGPPDLLLFSSGVGFQNKELDEGKEMLTVRTNCEGMLRIVDHFYNYIRDETAKGGFCTTHKAHIAVITSVAGTKGMGVAPAYSATKKMQSTYLSALRQLSHMERIPVVVTDIRPGFVSTEILSPDKKYPMKMSVEKAARCILRGLERKSEVITFDCRFRIIAFLWKMIPQALWERITWIGR